MTTVDLDAPAFEAGTHLAGDAVIGCWFVDRFDVLRPPAREPCPASVRWDLLRGKRMIHVLRTRRADGGSPVGRPDIRVPAVPGERSVAKTVQQWLRLVHRARRSLGIPGLDGRTGEGGPVLAVPLPHAEAGRGVAFLGAAHVTLASALEALAPFLATLDQRAVRHALTDALPGNDGGAYRRLDRTIAPDAPLALALDMEPEFARLLVHAASQALPQVEAAVAAGPEALRALVVRRFDERRHGDAPGLALHVADAWRDLAESSRDEIRATMGGQGPNSDPARVLASLFKGLPTDWLPRDAQGWVALALCSPALEATRKAGEHRATLLDARGDWPWYLRRLCRAHGGPHTALAAALQDRRDVDMAYAAEVLGPAAALADERGNAHWWGHVAQALLGDGRRLCGQLEASRRWHAGRHAVMAVVTRHPNGAAPSAWPVAWPTVARAGITVAELTTRAALAAEGARGRDADGIRGLTHCVGGYVGACLSGRSRILSLRAPDGSRASTAEVTWDHGTRKPRVVQHRGLRNSVPPVEALRALEGYVEDVEAGRVMVDDEALAPLPGGDADDRRWPYDHLAPGAWQEVRDAWDPFVPRRLRGIAPEALVSLARMVDVPSREGWRPVPAMPLDGVRDPEGTPGPRAA